MVLLILLTAWDSGSQLGAPAYWPWLLTGTQVAALWAAGAHQWWGWPLGASVQPPWIAYALMTDQLGFVPGCMFSGAVQTLSFLRGQDNKRVGQLHERSSTMTERTNEHVHVAVVGGGQAGLAVSYHLRQRGLDHVVLDASERAGDAWRERWDSLRLFTPARLDHLDGMVFPGPSAHVPTKDEFADYLASYERQFALPVRHGTRVSRLSAGEDGFKLDTSAGAISADAVVVAMSSLQVPHVPAMAADLHSDIRSMHSVDYRNPAQLREGAVLIVGVGNTGAEIGVEVAQTHETWLAGAESGHLPFRVDGYFGRHVGTRIVAALFLHVLTTDTAIGRKVRPTMLANADPLLRERPGELRRSGAKRVPRIESVRDGLPVAADGTVLEVANVIWCTGFRSGLTEWVDLPVLDERGLPRHERGVVADQPGLYFVGQNFLYAKASEQIPGVSRDARYVVGHLEQPAGGHGPSSSPAHTRLAT